jgi:hypothetical protein
MYEAGIKMTASFLYNSFIKNKIERGDFKLC